MRPRCRHPKGLGQHEESTRHQEVRAEMELRMLLVTLSSKWHLPQVLQFVA